MSYSLYVHMPFCKKKCNYCDFPSYAGKEAYIDAYLESLRGESGYVSSLYDRPEIGTLYIGGGTPTLLSKENIVTLFDIINKDFEVIPGCEATVEANPGTVTREKLAVLKGHGVNRISLGAQTFNNGLLKRLGRIHMEHEINDAFEMIKEAGIRNINLDLIFALPGENLKDWERSLDKAVRLGPEHISAYNLQVEEGTPLYADKVDGMLTLPEEGTELKMYRRAIDVLRDKGYEHYEISSFAKRGHECEHNIAYWTMKNYIGLGAGAHSFIDGVRTENSPELDRYLSGNIKEIKKDRKNTKKESMQEFIFLGLRLMRGFNLNDFTRNYGISFREIYRKELSELVGDGLLTIDGKNVRLTEKGLPIANEVFKAFL